MRAQQGRAGAAAQQKPRGEAKKRGIAALLPRGWSQAAPEAAKRAAQGGPGGRTRREQPRPRQGKANQRAAAARQGQGANQRAQRAPPERASAHKAERGSRGDAPRGGARHGRYAPDAPREAAAGAPRRADERRDPRKRRGSTRGRIKAGRRRTGAGRTFARRPPGWRAYLVCYEGASKRPT